MLCFIFVLGQSRLFRFPHNVLALHLLIYFFLFPFSILSFAVQGALRASPAASPPQNMHTTIIFNGVWMSTVATLVFFLEGKQVRRERDEQMYEEQGEKSTQSYQMVRTSSRELEEEK